MILGWEQWLVAVSILMQGTVAIMAFYRASQSLEKHRVTWSMFGLVFSLMAFRRMTSLGIVLGVNIPLVFPEAIAFIISLILCIAVYNISKILPALEYLAEQMPCTSRKLKAIATELNDEMKCDLAGLDAYKHNGDSLKRSKENVQSASRKLVDIAHSLEKLTSGTPPEDRN